MNKQARYVLGVPHDPRRTMPVTLAHPLLSYFNLAPTFPSAPVFFLPVSVPMLFSGVIAVERAADSTMTHEFDNDNAIRQGSKTWAFMHLYGSSPRDPPFTSTRTFEALLRCATAPQAVAPLVDLTDVHAADSAAILGAHYDLRVADAWLRYADGLLVSTSPFKRRPTPPRWKAFVDIDYTELERRLLRSYSELSVPAGVTIMDE